MRAIGTALIILSLSAHADNWKAWKDCIPNSIGPGGCDSIGPGGGKSIGPGGGLSIGPGGGMSIGPGGGQSIGPGGGQSIAPGGGKSLTRDLNRGLDPDTLRPYPYAMGDNRPAGPVTEIPSPPPSLQPWHYQNHEGTSVEEFGRPPYPASTIQAPVIQPPPQAPLIDYRRFDTYAQTLQSIGDPDQLRITYSAMQLEAEEIIRTRTHFLVSHANHSYPDDPKKATQQALSAIKSDPEISDVQSRLTEVARAVRMKLAGQ